MPKDLKIGMIIGVALLIAATLVISFLSEGSLESRLEDKFNKELGPNSPGNGVLEKPAAAKDSNKEDDDEVVAAPPAEKPAEITEKIHIVAQGETLNDIADKYFGNPMMINRIVDENPQIPDSYELKAGMKLKIPE